MRPASEKRQGTKSRWVGHPALERALWGFGGAAEDLGWWVCWSGALPARIERTDWRGWTARMKGRMR